MTSIKPCNLTSRARYGMFILAIIAWSSVFVVAGVPESEKASTKAATAEECDNPQMRIVQEEELKRKNGKDDEEIWLSILGRVFDVSAGKEYYGEGAGYSGLAARDASVGFVTGTFTEDEAKKLPSETLNAAQLAGIDEWRDFYNKEKKYSFVGLLEGTYYDDKGNPTEELKQIHLRLNSYKKQQLAKKLAKKKEREQKIKNKKRSK